MVMRREIEALRSERRDLRGLVDFLYTSSEDKAQDALRRLRDSADVDAVHEAVRDGSLAPKRSPPQSQDSQSLALSDQVFSTYPVSLETRSTPGQSYGDSLAGQSMPRHDPNFLQHPVFMSADDANLASRWAQPSLRPFDERSLASSSDLPNPHAQMVDIGFEGVYSNMGLLPNMEEPGMATASGSARSYNLHLSDEIDEE